MMPSTVERLEPLRFSVGPEPLAERRTPAAPAPPRSEPSFIPSISDASMSSSFGYSCSARSYLREIGRNTSVATWLACWARGLYFFGISRLIMVSPSFARPGLDEQGALHHARGPQVPVPALDRVLFDVAVAAEQLDAVGADLHPLLGAEPAGDRRLAAEVDPPVGATGGAVGGEPHAARLDPDFRDREGDALAVGDRFAEGLAVVDVGDDVVEDRLRGADGEAAPGDPCPVDALGRI